MSKATEDVMAERQRQIEAEGWTDAHDDNHDAGDLAKAGAASSRTVPLDAVVVRQKGTE